MKIRRILRAAMGAALLAMSAIAPTQAQTFNKFFVFGDSLSDAGTYTALVNGVPTQLRFTVNPYPVWNQILGAQYGANVTPYLSTSLDNFSSTVVGGTNYAQGGACVNSAYGASCPIFPLNTLGETQQIATYLSANGGRADPNALYSVWAGANDVFSQLTLISAGSVTVTQGLTNLVTAATQNVANVNTLSVAGARYIIVPNLPNIAATPGATSQGATAQAFYAAAVTTYNSTLVNGLRALGGSNIIYANVNGLVGEVMANPGAYGMTNVTVPACTTSTSLICNTSTLVAPNAQNVYLFADGVHPTPAGHAIMAAYMSSIISAPNQVGLIVQAPVYAARGIYRTLDTRTIPGLRTGTGFSAYANFDYAPYSVDSSTSHNGLNGQATSGYAGLDYRFGGGLMAGALINYTDGSYNFSNSTGNYGVGLFTGTLYASYAMGSAWGQLSGTLGSIDYNSITRTFQLGPAQRSNSGSANGTYGGARLALGYDFNVSSDLTLGPIGALTYQYASVDAYSETQANSTAMAFGSQSRNLFYGTIGAQAAIPTQIGSVPVRPNLSVSYNYDFTNQSRTVTAGLVGAPTTFAMPVYQPGRQWAEVNVGMTADFTPNWSGNVTIGGQAGQSGVQNYFGNVGVSYKF